MFRFIEILQRHSSGSSPCFGTVIECVGKNARHASRQKRKLKKPRGTITAKAKAKLELKPKTNPKLHENGGFPVAGQRVASASRLGELERRLKNPKVTAEKVI